MHEYIFYNDRIATPDNAAAPLVSPASFYGRGIFTTISIESGKPDRWDLHWARLQDNARKTGLDISEFDFGSIAEALAELIKKNRAIDGLARVTLFDERPSTLWPAASLRKAGMLITTKDSPPPPDGHLKLAFSPYRVDSRSPLAGVKSCNYLENLLALEEAHSRGFDEAVRLNERNEVVSGCMSNIFWRCDGKWYTPALHSGCLAGVTRALMIERGAIETDGSLFDLERADALCLTSSGLGERWVGDFEGRIFDGPVSHQAHG